MIKNLCWEVVDDKVFVRCLQVGEQTQSAQARRSQDHGVHLALAYPPNPGLHIAPNRHDLRPHIAASRPVENLHGAPRSSGSYPEAMGNIIKAPANTDAAHCLT